MGDALEIVQLALAAHDAGDDAGLAAVVDDQVELEAPGEVRLVGRAAVTEYLGAFLGAFDDVAVDVHVLAEQGDMVVEEYTMTATHTRPLPQPFDAVPPTSRRVAVRVAEVYRVRDGRIVENRLYYDPAALTSQLS
jgi:ketosteroid isomerase-like protein